MAEGVRQRVVAMQRQKPRLERFVFSLTSYVTRHGAEDAVFALQQVVDQRQYFLRRHDLFICSVLQQEVSLNRIAIVSLARLHVRKLAGTFAEGIQCRL